MAGQEFRKRIDDDIRAHLFRNRQLLVEEVAGNDPFRSEDMAGRHHREPDG